MASKYIYKPDHLKLKSGRPRKYENGYQRPKYVPKEKGVQQVAEELRGVPVIQLDYTTGEYIDEYPSMSAFAIDYDIPLSSVTGKFSKKTGYSCIARFPKLNLLIIKKDAYMKAYELIRK